MGADLYLGNECDVASKFVKPLFDKAVALRDKYPRDSAEAKVLQEIVTATYDAMYPEGSYFRDSYNCTSVFGTLGLSWWQDCGKLLNKAGNLNGANLVKFRKMVASAKQTLPTKQELLDDHATVAESGENSVESWHEMYARKRTQLLAFLDKAIKTKKNDSLFDLAGAK